MFKSHKRGHRQEKREKIAVHFRKRTIFCNTLYLLYRCKRFLCSCVVTSSPSSLTSLKSNPEITRQRSNSSVKSSTLVIEFWTLEFHLRSSLSNNMNNLLRIRNIIILPRKAEQLENWPQETHGEAVSCFKCDRHLCDVMKEKVRGEVKKW